MTPLLSLTDVTRRHLDGRRRVAVLDRVSLEIDPGDHVGVWGPRGSGKSTLLKLAAGIERPDEGTVRFDGRDVTAMSGRERSWLLRSGGIALVCSEWRPRIAGTAVDLVAMACMGDGTPRREARSRARRVLARVGASDHADVAAGELALGERIRVGLAMALVREPRLLFVDEPAVLPSPMDSEDLYALLRSLGRDRDLAVVVASADLAAILGARRTMSVSHGAVRSMDEAGVVVPFPERRAKAGDSRL
jgi:predicted ABC-type transport system involved in lysophospholipase L1 biosynthesis ATPase subunit